MTSDRARMAETGEPYTVAARAIDAPAELWPGPDPSGGYPSRGAPIPDGQLPPPPAGPGPGATREGTAP